MTVVIKLEEPKTVPVYVSVKVAGGDATLRFDAKYLGPHQYADWVDSWSGRRDLDVLLDVLTEAHGVGDAAGKLVVFGKAVLAALLDQVEPAAPLMPEGEEPPKVTLSMAILQAYAQAMAEGRRGN